MSRVARMGGDAMTNKAGGNFDRELTIVGGKVRLRGPLQLEKGQTLAKMYVWLWQTDANGTGAAVTAVLGEADFNSAAAQGTTAMWKTTAQPSHGTFTTGPATGMALAILRRPDGSTVPYWWSDSNIRLTTTAPVTTTPLTTTPLTTTPTQLDTPLVKALHAFINALAKG